MIKKKKKKILPTTVKPRQEKNPTLGSRVIVSLRTVFYVDPNKHGEKKTKDNDKRTRQSRETRNSQQHPLGTRKKQWIFSPFYKITRHMTPNGEPRKETKQMLSKISLFLIGCEEKATLLRYLQSH